jgi:hypothetical protein
MSIFSGYGMPFNLLFKLILLLIVNSCSATASELECLVVFRIYFLCNYNNFFLAYLYLILKQGALLPNIFVRHAEPEKPHKPSLEVPKPEKKRVNRYQTRQSGTQAIKPETHP